MRIPIPSTCGQTCGYPGTTPHKLLILNENSSLTKIKAAMHNLQVIKNVSADALDDEGAGGLTTFYAVVDPDSVLEMAAIIEALLGHIEQSGTNPELVNEVKRRLCGGFAISTASEE